MLMVVIGHDGLDPVFASIEEVIVIGCDMVLFSVQHCDVCYFDDHYHAYVIDHTSKQSLENNRSCTQITPWGYVDPNLFGSPSLTWLALLPKYD